MLKRNNAWRYLNQRRRVVWREWLSAVDELRPIGSMAWRTKNVAFRSDAVELLTSLNRSKNRPRVIYADPPYTKDQYSRFYHLFETIILYDYPDAVGKGRCRTDRQVSSFSLKSEVNDAMERLIGASAELGADLVLSYPTNGLLKDFRTEIPRILRQHYRRCSPPH